MRFPRVLLPLLALVLGIFFWRDARTAKASTTTPKTINAASCNVSDLLRAVNQAHDGDTVTIPAGTCTWTSTLTVSGAINLLGSTQGTTTIIDNIDRPHCRDNPAIFMNISANAPWRLANLTIQGRAPDPGQCSEHIKIITNSHSFRVDHILFTSMTSSGIRVDGDAWGLIDHCKFNGNHKRGVLVHHTTWGQVGSWGDNSWAQPDSMGTNQAVFVEDSDFTGLTNASGAGAIACEFGGRCVARHNTDLPFVGTHGTDSGKRNRSVRHFEVYNNTISDNGSLVTQAMQLRGGTSLFFNNTITPTVRGSYGGRILALEIYREVDAQQPWGPAHGSGEVPYSGACTGTAPFDSNDGIVYDSGIYNGSTGATDVLTDTRKHWAMNQWVGYSLRNNTTGPWGASIESNTATTISTYPSIYRRIPHTWNAGDSYQILKVYPCLDQPGRGAGKYISGGSYALPPAPIGWPHQASDPVYAWNNTKSGSLISVIGPYYTHIQENRDYYDWTSSFDGTSGVGQGLLSARPATCTPMVAYWATDKSTLYQCSAKNNWTVYYVPFTYPHPLQGASSVSPTNLKVTGIH